MGQRGKKSQKRRISKSGCEVKSKAVVLQTAKAGSNVCSYKRKYKVKKALSGKEKNISESV